MILTHYQEGPGTGSPRVAPTWPCALLPTDDLHNPALYILPFNIMDGFPGSLKCNVFYQRTPNNQNKDIPSCTVSKVTISKPPSKRNSPNYISSGTKAC